MFIDKKDAQNIVNTVLVLCISYFKELGDMILFVIIMIEYNLVSYLISKDIIKYPTSKEKIK